LQGVVIRIVMLFADQHTRRNGETFDQFLWCQRSTGGEFADGAKVGMVPSLRGDGRRGRRDVMGLAGSQQAEQAEQQKPHRFSLVDGGLLDQ
jgi:hypothetical protein